MNRRHSRSGLKPGMLPRYVARRKSGSSKRSRSAAGLGLSTATHWTFAVHASAWPVLTRRKWTIPMANARSGSSSICARGMTSGPSAMATCRTSAPSQPVTCRTEGTFPPSWSRLALRSTGRNSREGNTQASNPRASARNSGAAMRGRRGGCRQPVCPTNPRRVPSAATAPWRRPVRPDACCPPWQSRSRRSPVSPRR